MPCKTIIIPQYKPWTPAELPLPEYRYYTEADIQAIVKYIRDEEDARILTELLSVYK